LANWKPQDASDAFLDRDDSAPDVDPLTSEPVSKPKHLLSAYDRHSRGISEKIQTMLEEIHKELAGGGPTYEEIEYISNACGFPAYAVRDWCEHT
jgi:hypothetical protein